jgi:hypothetical protein
VYGKQRLILCIISAHGLNAQRRKSQMESKMVGAIENYKIMLDQIKNWNAFDGEGNYLDIISHALGDAPYFEWIGDDLKTERDIYNDIETKYIALKEALENAVVPQGMSNEEMIAICKNLDGFMEEKPNERRTRTVNK